MTKTTNEVIEREINYLTDPEIKYVSIVNRGANGVPFKVVKNLDGDNMQKVLHSIIAPKGIDPADIKKSMGEDLESIVKLDSGMESGAHVTFVQHPRDAFKADSLELFDIDKERGIKGLRGVPKEEEAKGLIGKLFAKKHEVVAFDEKDPAIPKEEVNKYMGWELYEELCILRNAIEGILDQTAGDPQAKIEMVNTVIGNFTSYMADAITVTKGESIKIEKREDTTPAKETEMGEVKKDETPAVVEKSVDEVVTEKVEAAVKSMKDELTAAIKELADGLTAKMEESAKKADEAAEAVSKMAEMVPHEVTDSRVDKKPDTAKKADVFAGSIFKITS